MGGSCDLHLMDHLVAAAAGFWRSRPPGVQRSRCRHTQTTCNPSGMMCTPATPRRCSQTASPPNRSHGPPRVLCPLNQLRTLTFSYWTCCFSWCPSQLAWGSGSSPWSSPRQLPTCQKHPCEPAVGVARGCGLMLERTGHPQYSVLLLLQDIQGVLIIFRTSCYHATE